MTDHKVPENHKERRVFEEDSRAKRNEKALVADGGLGTMT